MKKIFLVLILMSSVASAQLSKVCPKIVDLKSSGEQYKNAQVQRTGGVGTSLTGFSPKPTIIFIKKNPATLSRALVYDSRGNLLFKSGPKLGCASSPREFRGQCRSRYKADVCTATVRSKALRQSGSAALYWKVNPTTCYRVKDASKCDNVKVRKPCDGRIIKSCGFIR